MGKLLVSIMPTFYHHLPPGTEHFVVLDPALIHTAVCKGEGDARTMLSDGMGQVAWSEKLPVSHAKHSQFKKLAPMLVTLKSLTLFKSCIVAYSMRIVVDSHAHTHETITATLTSHVLQG